MYILNSIVFSFSQRNEFQQRPQQNHNTQQCLVERIVLKSTTQLPIHKYSHLLCYWINERMTLTHFFGSHCTKRSQFLIRQKEWSPISSLRKGDRKKRASVQHITRQICSVILPKECITNTSTHVTLSFTTLKFFPMATGAEWEPVHTEAREAGMAGEAEGVYAADPGWRRGFFITATKAVLRAAVQTV